MGEFGMSVCVCVCVYVKSIINQNTSTIIFSFVLVSSSF